MSIELPEARILAQQITEALCGRTVASWGLKDHAKLQRIGFLNKDTADYERLVGKTLQGATSRGNTVHLKLEAGQNLLVGPEYGGVVRYTPSGPIPTYHFKMSFEQGGTFWVRLTSMGIVHSCRDEDLPNNYLYQRDFRGAPEPCSKDLPRSAFLERLRSKGTQLKPLLVGKDALVVGLSNSAFQDVLFRAAIHPRRKASELSEQQLVDLYEAIATLLEERRKLGGKEDFVDLHGVAGRYSPVMGPNKKGTKCVRCRSAIDKIALGGGQVFFCPECQR